MQIEDLFKNLFSMAFLKSVKKLDVDMLPYSEKEKYALLLTINSVNLMSIAFGMTRVMLSAKPETFLLYFVSIRHLEVRNFVENALLYLARMTFPAHPVVQPLSEQLKKGLLGGSVFSVLIPIQNMALI